MNQPECEISDAWYAMRVTYNRVMVAKALLDRVNVRNFVPMRYKERVVCGKKVRELVPAISNLIFVYSNTQQLRELKRKMDYLQYIVNSRTKEKIIVPQLQMQRFMEVQEVDNEHILWFAPQDVNFSKGMNVRVIDGQFKGYEGTLVKVKGARDKRVVVAIEGVIAVAMASINPSFLQLVDNDQSVGI